VALKELQAAAPVLGVDLQFVEVPGPPGFAEAFAAIMREHADALFVFPDPLTFGNRESIVGFANKNSIPALFGAREFVEVGGLMSYGSDYPALFRRAGNYVGCDVLVVINHRIVAKRPSIRCPGKNHGPFPLTDARDVGELRGCENVPNACS
jgi:ABC-type uncharacterized transport system substrate-binding protein